MLASFLILFLLIDVVTPHFIMLTIPLVLQEMILAIWLLVRGFNSSEIDYSIDEE